MNGREPVYTEVDTRAATLPERARMLRMMWEITGQPDVTADHRRRARRLALRHWVFSWRPRVSWYVISR